MPKFNTSSISDMLLNEESRSSSKTNFKIVHIDIDDIIPNERNKEISMPAIEDLAENIGIVGLEQNLVVAPQKDGKYPLLTGHRRLAALQLLVNQQGREDLRMVPCVINDPARFQYELSEKSKEDLIWVSSNVMTRRPTSQDLLKFTQTLNNVYEELRKKNPKAKIGKRKEFIAKELNVSESQIQILNSINAHLTKQALNAFMNDEISLVVARDLSKLTENEQLEILSGIDDISQLTSGQILLFKKQKQEEKADSRPFTDKYNSDSFSKISDITFFISDMADKKELSGRNADKAQRLTDRIIKDLEALEKIYRKNK